MSRRIAAMLVIGLAMALTAAACAEPATNDTASNDTASNEAMSNDTANEEMANEEMAEAEGCREAGDVVAEALSASVGAMDGTLDATSSHALDVSEMIYGAWDVTAGTVTTADGAEVTAVWATRIPTASEWSSSTGAETNIFSVNEAAMEVSDFAAATMDDFGRELSEDDAEAVEAIDCLS